MWVLCVITVIRARHLVVGCILYCVLLMSMRLVVFFFFFQAEDGIRDLIVTGVQTCALPILWRAGGTLVTVGDSHTKTAPSPARSGRNSSHTTSAPPTARRCSNGSTAPCLEIGRASCRERV